MDRLIAWLSERKPFTVILAFTYLTVVIFFHKDISGIFDWLSEKLSFKVYNELIFAISLIITVVFGVFVLITILKGERRFLKIFYWVFTAFLVFLSYKTLVVFNVENIHFPQYAILTLPAFVFFKHFAETVFWVALSGAFDEAYQYFVLYRNNNVYLDFNDIVLNLIGAGIGVVLIYTLLDKKSESVALHANMSRRWSRFIAFTITACILFGGMLLYATGILRFYPEANAPNALIVLSRIPAQTHFWVIPTVGKPFHIFHPVEGIFFSAILIACYSLLDYGLEARKDNAMMGHSQGIFEEPK
jgi:VanZ family protein